jgi:(p)ppGpp synthase/HD superfamily hydrolase
MLPVPGEDIRGYITQGRGISLHTNSCSQGVRLIAREGREVEVQWDEDATKFDWEVTLEVTARDRVNLLRDLTGALSSTKANVLRASISTVGDSVRDRFRVAVRDSNQLHACIASIRGVTGVLHVARTGSSS